MSRSKGKGRCVVVGGADILCPDRVRAQLRSDDYVIYCDSGLEHMDVLGAPPDLIVGDFDSFADPHLDAETITLPVAKDDTDTVFAVREGMRRGFTDFLLAGAIGGRLDHTLVNVYLLNTLADHGCRGLIVDDCSECELICADPGSDEATVYIEDDCSFFSLVATEGPAKGVSINGAKFPADDAVIAPGYQYATSNEVLPGGRAKVTVKQGRLLLIKIAAEAAKGHQ